MERKKSVDSLVAGLVDVRRKFGSFLIVDLADGHRVRPIVAMFVVEIVNRSFLAGDSIIGVVVDVRHDCRDWLGVSR